MESGKYMKFFRRRCHLWKIILPRGVVKRPRMRHTFSGFQHARRVVETGTWQIALAQTARTRRIETRLNPSLQPDAAHPPPK